MIAELESAIEDKTRQLAEGLAQKYKEAFDKANESLKGELLDKYSVTIENNLQDCSQTYGY